jgi:cation diffusion facilitator family transporter
MSTPKLQTANKLIKQITYLGVITNIVLAAVKFTAGIAAGSMALVADAVHSLSDMVTDIVVLLGVHFGTKEPDHEHPYGHGRLETFSAFLIALVLVAVGILMIKRASFVIANVYFGRLQLGEVGSAVLWVALVSVAVKEALYFFTKKVAVRTRSPALYANAWHHRSDALSSLAVIAGFIALRLGFEYGDQVATIAVGLMIILVGAKIVGGCFREFAERAVDSQTIEQIEKIIASEKRIRQWHKLRSRSVGREIFIDLHILVDPQLSITDAHEISEALEIDLHAQLSRPVNMTIHIEPDNLELRK